MRAQLGRKRRYAHTIRVARLAGRLARAHGEDPSAARTAGMLHDLARLYGPERLLAECEARSLPIDDFERRHPVVLHARLGAELAREQFGVTDEATLNAIRRHTVGAAEMTRLDAILYLADALEPGRDFPEREALEVLSFSDLDGAMAALLRNTVSHLHKRRLEAAPQTFAALRAYETLERRPLPA